MIFVKNNDMEDKFYKSSGIALMIGSFLLVATMVLHPIGADPASIMKIFNLAVFTHAMAIVAILFLGFGFLGLCKFLKDRYGFSSFAYVSLVMALIAGMFAGTINGLVIPFFVKKMVDMGQTNIDNIVKFAFIFNKCLDYILVSGMSLAILIWSLLMINKKVFPTYLGYFGVLFNVAFLIGLAINFDYSTLTGFSVFVFAMVVWVVSTGYLLSKEKS